MTKPRLETWGDRVARAVHPVDAIMGAVEAVVLAVVVRLASWGSSIPNVVMVSRSAESMFSISPAWAMAIAVSLELIGHAVVSHWQAAHAWNETKRVRDPAARAGLALGMVVVYFAIDVLMVGALAWSQYMMTGDGRIWIAISYPVIGITVAIVTHERAALVRVQVGVQIERDRAHAERVERKAAPAAPAERPIERLVAPQVDQWRAIYRSMNGERSQMSAARVQHLLNEHGYGAVPGSTARRWAIEARAWAPAE